MVTVAIAVEPKVPAMPANAPTAALSKRLLLNPGSNTDNLIGQGRMGRQYFRYDVQSELGPEVHNHLTSINDFKYIAAKVVGPEGM